MEENNEKPKFVSPGINTPETYMHSELIKMTIADCARRSYETAKEKGFWEPGPENNVGTRLMLTTSELGEAMEAYRCDKIFNNGIRNEMFYRMDKSTDENFISAFETYVKDTFEDELADAMIRIMNMAHGMGINIQKHVELKMKYNETRPYKHGKRF